MCGQHNARVTARDNSGQNTDKEHIPSPRKEIKFSDPAAPEIEPGPQVGRQGLYRSRHGDTFNNNMYKTMACPTNFGALIALSKGKKVTGD